MKNFYESDYAINKRSKNIVYPFVNGRSVITLKSYLEDNPDNTAEDFAELKALSDGIYHEQEIVNQRQARHNISLHSSPEIENYSTPSMEDQFETEAENLEYQRRKLAFDIFVVCGNLTPIQLRRLILFRFHSRSTRKIARAEGVDRRAVWDSLQGCKKKFEKFCKKVLRTPPDF